MLIVCKSVLSAQIKSYKLIIWSTPSVEQPRVQNPKIFSGYDVRANNSSRLSDLGGCGSGGRRGPPPVHMSKCPWARQWSPNCPRWSGPAPCVVAHYHQCARGTNSVWSFGWKCCINAVFCHFPYIWEAVLIWEGIGGLLLLLDSFEYSALSAVIINKALRLDTQPK